MVFEGAAGRRPCWCCLLRPSTAAPPQREAGPVWAWPAFGRTLLQGCVRRHTAFFVCSAPFLPHCGHTHFKTCKRRTDMKFFEALSGNTPLIRIDYRLDGRPGAVYAKLESFNLSGSI